MRTVHLVFVSVGLLLACLVAALLGLRGGAGWLEAFAIGVPLGLVYTAVCIAARYPCLAAPLSSTGAVRIAVTHASGALLSAGLWGVLGLGISRGLDALPELKGAAEHFTGELPTVLMVGVLIYLLAVAVQYLIIAMEKARAAEVQGVQSRVLAREAELRALRAQVDPHFLFNSLNSISALTADDPAAARRMCLLLSGFLRQSLALGSRDRITFDEELALVNDYLAIEKVRFGARLVIVQEIDDPCRACAVPPFLLQPLVENAVRHGVAHLLPGGTIRIVARLTGGRLSVVIENDRDAERPTTAGAGVGLANVRGRLRSLFGEESRVESRADRGSFRVEVTFPAVEVPAAPATGARTAGARAAIAGGDA